jgi:hypothetical protein
LALCAGDFGLENQSRIAYCPNPAIKSQARSAKP